MDPRRHVGIHVTEEPRRETRRGPRVIRESDYVLAGQTSGSFPGISGTTHLSLASITADCTDGGAVQSAGLRSTTRFNNLLVTISDDSRSETRQVGFTGRSSRAHPDAAATPSRRRGGRPRRVSVAFERRALGRGTKESRRTVLGGSCIDRGRVSLPLDPSPSFLRRGAERSEAVSRAFRRGRGSRRRRRRANRAVLIADATRPRPGEAKRQLPPRTPRRSPTMSATRERRRSPLS